MEPLRLVPRADATEVDDHGYRVAKCLSPLDECGTGPYGLTSFAESAGVGLCRRCEGGTAQCEVHTPRSAAAGRRRDVHAPPPTKRRDEMSVRPRSSVKEPTVGHAEGETLRHRPYHAESGVQKQLEQPIPLSEDQDPFRRTLISGKAHAPGLAQDRRSRMIRTRP